MKCGGLTSRVISIATCRESSSKRSPGTAVILARYSAVLSANARSRMLRIGRSVRGSRVTIGGRSLPLPNFMDQLIEGRREPFGVVAKLFQQLIKPVAELLVIDGIRGLLFGEVAAERVLHLHRPDPRAV